MKRILIVEDDEFLRDVYFDSLAQSGFEVEKAIDGEEGLKKMQEKDWDLVLLDIVMPKLSGFDVLKNYKASAPKNTIKKVIFLTNIDKQEELNQIKEFGTEYLIKSQITPGELVTKINSLIPSS